MNSKYVVSRPSPEIDNHFPDTAEFKHTENMTSMPRMVGMLILDKYLCTFLYLSEKAKRYGTNNHPKKPLNINNQFEGDIV